MNKIVMSEFSTLVIGQPRKGMSDIATRKLRLVEKMQANTLIGFGLQPHQKHCREGMCTKSDMPMRLTTTSLPKKKSHKKRTKFDQLNDSRDAKRGFRK